MPKSSPDILLTFLKLDIHSKKPLYIQLYNGIRDAVHQGMLKYGDRMPSTRALGKYLGISRNIVILAFEQLVLEGYLTSKTGAGTFICEEVELPDKITPQKILTIAEAKKENAGFKLHINFPEHGKYLINDDRIEPVKAFQTSVPSFEDFPFAVWSRIAGDIYRNIHLLHLGYDDIQGHLPLRNVLADHLRINRSIDCTADQLVIVNGSRQGMHLLAEMFLKKGDQCWMEDPGYASAKCAFERFGGVLCPVPIGNKGLDIDYATENYPAAKIAYVTPSHQYPLGITMPLAERIRLLQHAKKKGMLIIEDDYDSEFRYNGRPLPALRGLDNSGHVIYLGTFSKILFPALRIGYVVMPTAEMARQLSFIKMITDRQNPAIDQAILCEFIRSGHFARHLRRMRLLYKKNQDYLVFLLKKYLGDHITIAAGDAGMHFVVSFVKDSHAEAVRKQRDSKGIILIPIEELAISFKHKNSFLLGFTGFTNQEMERAVHLLKEIISFQ